MTNASENPTKLLLHACCGPCSLEPVRSLRARGIEPCIYYANSNIHPAGEYARRRDTIAQWARAEGLRLTEGPYDPAGWEEATGRVGEAARERYGVIAKGAPCAEDAGTWAKAAQARMARCRACYRLRFEESARFAAQNGFDALGTTLSVSPYQYTEVIREELERACGRAGIEARFEDYRPLYDEATRRSREAGMYRQNFCGCRLSDEEARFERELRRAQRKEAQEKKRAEGAAERSAQEAQRARKRAERADYDKKQARKRAVLKQLREASRAEGSPKKDTHE